MWSLDCEANESIKAGQLVSHSHFLMVVVLKHGYGFDSTCPTDINIKTNYSTESGIRIQHSNYS